MRTRCLVLHTPLCILLHAAAHARLSLWLFIHPAPAQAGRGGVPGEGQTVPKNGNFYAPFTVT